MAWPAAGVAIAQQDPFGPVPQAPPQQQPAPAPPPQGASRVQKVRGFLLVLLLVVALLAIGFGLAKLIALPFGGVGTIGGMLLGLVVVIVVLGVLAIVGRRRQAKAQERARAARAGGGG